MNNKYLNIQHYNHQYPHMKILLKIVFQKFKD